MNADPPDGPLPRVSSPWAYRPLAQLAAKVDCALLMARSDPMAAASLPEMRARRRPGTAIAAMMPMIATTISSSMRVKPFSLRTFIPDLLKLKGVILRGVKPTTPEQPQCHPAECGSRQEDTFFSA